MKFIIYLITASIALKAASYKYSDIDMEVVFSLSSNNKISKDLIYYSKFAIFYDSKKQFIEKNYCFNDANYIFVTKNSKKSKYKVCLNEKNISNIYVLNKNHRYQKVDDIDVQIKKIYLKVKDKESNSMCKDNVLNYEALNDKINQCLKEI